MDIFVFSVLMLIVALNNKPLSSGSWRAAKRKLYTLTVENSNKGEKRKKL